MTEPQWEFGQVLWETVARLIPPATEEICHMCLVDRPATALIVDLVRGHLSNIPVCDAHLGEDRDLGLLWRPIRRE